MNHKEVKLTWSQNTLACLRVVNNLVPWLPTSVFTTNFLLWMLIMPSWGDKVIDLTIKVIAGLVASWLLLMFEFLALPAMYNHTKDEIIPDLRARFLREKEIIQKDTIERQVDEIILKK